MSCNHSSNYTFHVDIYLCRSYSYLAEKDISEKKNIIDKNPKLVKKLSKLWKDWDANNVEMQNPVYARYYKARDAFFKESMPEAAKKAGYNGIK